MDPIVAAAASGIDKLFDQYLSLGILALAVAGLGYLHHVCRQEQMASRADTKALADKFMETQVEQARTNEKVVGAIESLKEVIRSK